MLMNLEELVKSYDLKIKGVLHIGAHVGQEYTTYKNIGVQNIIFFEPIKSTFEKLKENIKDSAILINTALGNKIGQVEMFTEQINDGQSSSILEPDYHLIQHPNITFEGKEMVDITTLDSFIDYKNDYNFINIDVQGYELEVFKGGQEFLSSIDYIMTEVNRAELYKNCAKVEELDTYLGEYGFVRVETNWAGNTWGDAFYVKK
jgi:FkbM family methyltransferase